MTFEGADEQFAGIKIRATSNTDIFRIIHFKFAGIHIRGDQVTTKTAKINIQQNILLQ